MNYTIYRLDFFNGVRFGRGNLDSTEITFHADTLFSALYQEAIKLQMEREFLESAEKGTLVFSDGFPYKGKTYFIPKPMLQVRTDSRESKGDSREKKMIKNMKFLPQESLPDFKNGKLRKEQMEALKDLGTFSMKVSVGIRGNEEPQPYRVSAFYFKDGNGLYIILGYQEEPQKEMFEVLLDSLSYTGIGGKKSAGLGRFEYMEERIPADFEKRLQKKGKENILLSTALPEETELASVLDGASYSLLKRSGFVDSERYAQQQMKKQDLYVFAAGSCFSRTFTGRVITEKNGGTHPIYRYAKALFLGVDL